MTNQVPPTPRHAAVYARVSLDEIDPKTGKPLMNLQNQTAPLEQWCRQNGFQIYQTYTDKQSGSSEALQREGFKELLEAAKEKKFELVAISAVDRLSRKGIFSTLTVLHKLKVLDIRVYSRREGEVNVDSPLGEFLISVAAFVGWMELANLVERTRTAMKRIAEEIKNTGRHTTAKGNIITSLGSEAVVLDEAEVLRLRRKGYTLRRLAAEFQCSRTPIVKILKKNGLV